MPHCTPPLLFSSLSTSLPSPSLPAPPSLSPSVFHASSETRPTHRVLERRRAKNITGVLATAFRLVGEQGEAASDWAFHPTARIKNGGQKLWRRALGKSVRLRNGALQRMLVFEVIRGSNGFESQLCPTTVLS